MQQPVQGAGQDPTQQVQESAPLSMEQQDAEIRQAIRRYIQDPGFRAYVDRVEALWDEVEQETDEGHQFP